MNPLRGDEPKTAARRFAEEYRKATGLPVRVFADVRRGNLIEEDYVHWLEDQLAQILASLRALKATEKPVSRSGPVRPPVPPR